MKHPFRFSILPYFTMGAGGLGLALRLWLFSATDAKGLLPAAHLADTLLYILSALVVGGLFLATRQLTAVPGRKKLLRKVRMPGYLLAGICLLAAAWMDFTKIPVSLARPAAIACLIGGLILMASAFGSLKNPFPLRLIFTVVLMVQTVAQCQIWGSESQLQVYFFPLLASVFSILTAYQVTALAADQGNRKLLAFFGQCALFFCCVSLNTQLWPMYMGMGLWAIIQLIPSYPTKKEI